MKCYDKSTEPILQEHCCCFGIGHHIDKYGEGNWDITQSRFNINEMFGILFNKDMQKGNIVSKRDVSYQ